MLSVGTLHITKETTQTHCYNPVVPTYLFWHIIHMDDNADAKRNLLASPPADWRRQLGRPHITWLSTIQQDLKQHHLTLLEAADLAQNRPLWRMMSTYGATQFYSCMPEMPPGLYAVALSFCSSVYHQRIPIGQWSDWPSSAILLMVVRPLVVGAYCMRPVWLVIIVVVGIAIIFKTLLCYKDAF